MSNDGDGVPGGAAIAEGDKAEGLRAAAAKDQKAKSLRAAAAKDHKVKGLRAAASEGESAEGLSASASAVEKVEVLGATASEVEKADVLGATASESEVEKAVDVVDPLRGAAAEVSNQSMSVSDATALVIHTFETLSIFIDRASQKALDDVISASLSEPIFREIFCSALVETDGTSPFACLRLLEWSSCLVKSNLLSEIDFFQIANAQQRLCQVVMAAKIKRQRYCKRIFISLFKSHEILRMYLDVVTSSNFTINGSSSFLKLLLDYTVAKSPLFLVYKHMLLELYVRAVFSPKDQETEVMNVAFRAILSKIGPDDFESSLYMRCLKTLSKNPDVIELQTTHCFLEFLSIDLSDYSPVLMQFLLSQSRHPNELRRFHALSIIATVSEKCEKLETLASVLDSIRAIIGGSDGELSRPYQRIGMINALEQLSRSSALMSQSETVEQKSIVTSLTSFLVTCYKDDGVKEVKVAILSALRSWIVVSSEAVLPELVSLMEIGLKEMDGDLRKGNLQLLKVICKCSDSLSKVVPLLDQLVELSKRSFLSLAERVDALYALVAILKDNAVDEEARAHWDDDLWALISQNKTSFISVQLLSELSEEDCSTVLDLLKSLLVEHLSRAQEYSCTNSLLQLLIHLVCHPSWRVRMAAHGAAKDILASSSGLTEDLLDFLINWLSLIREREQRLENSDVSTDRHLPSTEILVKCLILVGRYVIGHFPKAYSKLMICCHHPCVTNSNYPALVWKRLFRSLKLYRIIHIDLAKTQAIMKELLSHEGCRSNEHISESIFNSLQTLAQIIPNGAPRHGQGIEHRLLAANAASAPVGNVRAAARLQEPQSTQSQLVAPSGAQSPAENDPVARSEQDCMLPMSDKAFISFLKAAANAAVGATTSANVFVATWPLWSGSASIANKIALGVTLFAFLPWAVVTSGVAHSAADDDRWLGCAATMVLIEFIYGFCLGGVAGTALPDVSVAAVWCVATFLIVCVLISWSWVFSHLKWLKRIHLWSPYSIILQQEKLADDVAQHSLMSRLSKLSFKRGEAPRQEENMQERETQQQEDVQGKKVKVKTNQAKLEDVAQLSFMSRLRKWFKRVRHHDNKRLETNIKKIRSRRLSFK